MDRLLLNIENLLPEELKIKIYIEYFEVHILYDEIKDMIKSKQCQALYNIDLGKFLQKHFVNQSFITYLREQEKEFNFIYQNEIINKNIKYIDYYNLASLWLFNLYFLDLLKSPRSMMVRTSMFDKISF
jgi:hypothetical protein